MDPFRASKIPQRGSRSSAVLGVMVRAVLRAMARESSLVKGRKRLYAGALAFKTVLALAPAMAIFLGVLSHERLHGPREAVLDRVVNAVYPLRAGDRSGSEVIRDLNEAAKRQVRDSLRRYSDRSEAAGWLGLAVFVGVLIFLLHDVEDAFNFLWKIPKGRPLRAQVPLYTSILLCVPLLMAVAVGVQAWVEERGPFGTLLEGWIPGFLGMWLAWTVVLKWVPNIRVKWLPAAWGAFLALLLFEATRWGLGASFEYFVGSFRFYGAIWMLPVILIWLFVGWMILLFGVEVAYFTQEGWSGAKTPRWRK